MADNEIENGGLPDDDHINEIYAEAFADMDRARKEVHKHNNRILRAVKRALGMKLRTAIYKTAKEMEACPYAKWELVKKPRGDRQSHNIKPIDHVWVSQRAVGYEGDSWEGEIYIQLKERLWLEMHYIC